MTSLKLKAFVFQRIQSRNNDNPKNGRKRLQTILMRDIYPGYPYKKLFQHNKKTIQLKMDIFPKKINSNKQ